MCRRVLIVVCNGKGGDSVLVLSVAVLVLVLDDFANIQRLDYEYVHEHAHRGCTNW
jgi:hypothetical protein